ncbi:MAG: ankyrin repeat protein [Flavobacteriales bacterium]|jgi:ankyrin repeat protein
MSIIKHGFIFFAIGLIGCSSPIKDSDLIRFKGEYRNLAKAVEKEDTSAIHRIVSEQGLDVNYQEPKFGETLLMWAVQYEKYESCKVLLKLGADPNLKSIDNETSALMFSAKNYKTSDFLKLLLNYGGDANDSSDYKGVHYLRTPLISASSTRLESVKLLLQKGANINYMSHHHQTALRAAIDSKYINIAHYLMIEMGADFNPTLGSTIHGDTLFIVNSLRRCAFPLDSKEHKLKMEIVDYMLKRGVNYWETPVPIHYYKNYDSTYLNKY